MSVLFERVALIGIGLIGSSLAHVIRREKIASHIAGYAKSEETRNTAVQLGLVDSIHPTAASAVANADLVILCVPVGACGAIAQEISSALKPGSIVTDVGSVKAAVVRDVAPFIPAGVHFVPGHPIAGTEQSGPASGFAELFLKRWCILTPLPDSDASAVARLEKFWHLCGSDVELMTPEHHDLV
ncbi:MAG: prephenate dehydrogenase/arogenate dehydrogenase family protein, partial [Aestuariivirga sp.]